jgi:hypothetical protein
MIAWWGIPFAVVAGMALGVHIVRWYDDWQRSRLPRPYSTVPRSVIEDWALNAEGKRHKLRAELQAEGFSDEDIRWLLGHGWDPFKRGERAS